MMTKSFKCRGSLYRNMDNKTHKIYSVCKKPSIKVTQGNLASLWVAVGSKLGLKNKDVCSEYYTKGNLYVLF